MSLNINKCFDKNKDVWQINISGEIDIHTSTDLKSELLKLNLENAKDLVLDATNLEYIDSTGLGVLIEVLKRLKQQEKDIYIINAKKNIKKIFNITGLDKIFKLEG